MPVTGPPAGARPETGGGDFTDLLRRRWWIVLLTLALGIVGGYGAGARQAPAYTSTTQVLVLPTTAADEVNLDTEAQLVTSLRTATQAGAIAGLEVPAATLAERIEITVPPNSETMKISFQATTPERAQRGAAAFAEAYLAARAEAAETAAAEWIDALTDQLTQLHDREAPAATIEALERELALRQATPHHPGEVISPATLPTHPTSPNRLMYLLSGGLAGLLIGLGGALVVQRLDPRVVTVADLPTGLADQLALELPGRRLEPVVTAPPSRSARQFARLRTTMAARAAPSPRDTAALWLICAAGDGPAAGVVTANLAAALGRGGHRVVVVAADPDSPLLTTLTVATSATTGLAEVAAGVSSLTETLLPAPAAPGVSVLPAGDLTGATELPAASTQQVLSSLRARADYVLLATRALTRSADAAILGATASAVLLVVEKRVTRRAQVRTAALDLMRVGSPMVGVALVPVGRQERKRPQLRPEATGPVRAHAAVPTSGGERPA